jgi:hypothetical protein
MSLRLVSKASWSPRTFHMMAPLCHADVRRFANDDDAPRAA